MAPPERVSVLLAGFPRLLADVVIAALDGQPDVRILGEPVPLEAAVAAAAAHRPDIVVCAVPPAAAERLYEALRALDPGIRVLELVADGRRARLHGPGADDLGEPSLLTLLAAVRGSGGAEQL
jgi:DNA-binding NarL/FixJ family response regulator